MKDLTGIKAGDAVAVYFSSGSMPTKMIVARTTPASVVLDDGTRFTRRGCKIGDAGRRYFMRTRACPWDEEAYQEQMRFAYTTVSLDQLRRIRAILDETA